MKFLPSLCLPLLVLTLTSSGAQPIHPKAFEMILCWMSDHESPVVTAFSLDAVTENNDQFDHDAVEIDGEWVRFAEYSHESPGSGTLLSYRRTDRSDGTTRIHFVDSPIGGGNLDWHTEIIGRIAEQTFTVNDQPKTVRVFEVLALRTMHEAM